MPARLAQRFGQAQGTPCLIGPATKKEPKVMVRPILFCKATFYGDRNSEIARPGCTRGIVRARESVSRQSAATAANARGNYQNLRARCGKGHAECCNRVYHPDGLARADGASTFR